ncbi:MAG: VanZ family protein [Planctomycetaceae bacterium]
MRSKLAVMMLAGYWLVLFIGTHIHIPSDVNKVLQEGSDKLIHAAMYALLAILWAVWRSSTTNWNWKETVQGIVVLALYGMCDELLQIPVGRHADVADWFADCVGLVAGFTVWWSAIVLFPRSAPSHTSPST